MQADGIDEFRRVIADFNSVASTSVKLTVAFPLADLVLSIGPPYPAAVPFLTSISMLVALIYIFHFWRNKDHLLLNRRLVAAILALCIFCLAYLFVSGTYVATRESPNGKTTRVVLGYELDERLEKQIDNARSDELERVENEEADIKKQSVGLEPYDIEALRKVKPAKSIEVIREEKIREISHKDPSAPFSKNSVLVVSVILFVLWVSMFTSLVIFIGTFVILQNPRSGGSHTASTSMDVG